MYWLRCMHACQSRISIVEVICDDDWWLGYMNLKKFEKQMELSVKEYKLYNYKLFQSVNNLTHK